MSDYSHLNLLKHLKAMGYDLPGPGVCAGLAQMSIQAFLAGPEEFARFNKRLELIATNSPTELSSRIRKAREAIAERSRKKRSDPKLAENEMVIVYLSEEEELLTETEAFFEGFEAYLYPGRHRELFVKSVSQVQVQEIIPLMESTALVAQGGMRVADSFPGIYSLVELQDYFIRLTQIMLHYCPPCDIAMGLGSVNHRITIFFDRARGVWIMNDANQLPTKEIVNPAELADAVIMGLAKMTGEGSAATKAAFNTTVYTTGKNEVHVKKILAEVKKSAEFSRAHAVTLSKVNDRTDVLQVSLANIAAKSELQDVVKDVLKAIAEAKRGALDEGGLDGNTPLHVAAQLNLPGMVRMLVDEKVSLETKNTVSSTPLAMAIANESVAAMTVLLEEDKGLVSAVVNGEGWLPLHVAAHTNSVEALKFLVSKGANPLAEIDMGISPVAIAAYQGSLEALKALIALVPKINLEKRREDGTTPLMGAVMNGHTKIVEALIEEKIDLNQKNLAGQTALHLAVDANDLATLKALIRGGAALNVEDKAGNTPLHLAAAGNKKEIFDFLMESGASTQKTNKAGKTPLSLGFISRALFTAFDKFTFLLKHIDGLQRRFEDQSDYQYVLRQLKKDLVKSYKEDSSFMSYSVCFPEVGLAFVAARNDNVAALRLLHAEGKTAWETESTTDWSLLHMAVANNSKEAVDFLISTGVNLTRAIYSSGATAVYFAAERGLTEILMKIAAHVPADFLNKANRRNETPLYAAVSKGHGQAVKLLIEAKVDVNQAADSGFSPIHQCIVNRDLSIFEMLVAVADLNKGHGDTGVTPLALAADYGYTDFLRILIGKAPPVDLGKKSTDGCTPLMRAVKKRNVEAAKMLIDALPREDMNEQDIFGVTALHRAIENNDLELVQALVAKGADVNLAKGRDAAITPIQLAVMGRRVDIVNFLLKKGADPRKADSLGQSALSPGTPLADALERKRELVTVIDTWLEQLRKAERSRALPAAVHLEFAALKDVIDKEFDANYEAFFSRYDARSFDGNPYLLLAFVAAEKGYKNLLERSFSKIDAGAKNPAGLSLLDVAEVYQHAELVRLLYDYEPRLEQKNQGGMPVVGLFSSQRSALSPSLAPEESASTDSSYEQLREKILEEVNSIKKETKAHPGFNPSRHRKTLKYLAIQNQLAECELAASQQADKYQYLKAQCEDKRSLLHHALLIETGEDAKSAGRTSKNVFDKIAELDAKIAASDLKPDS